MDELVGLVAVGVLHLEERLHRISIDLIGAVGQDGETVIGLREIVPVNICRHRKPAISPVAKESFTRILREEAIQVDACIGDGAEDSGFADTSRAFDQDFDAREKGEVFGWTSL